MGALPAISPGGGFLGNPVPVSSSRFLLHRLIHPGGMIDSMYTLYKFFDGNANLLYVGATICLGKRIEQHRTGKDWWCEVAMITVRNFDTRDELLDAEAEAIFNDVPKYNVMGKELMPRTLPTKPRRAHGEGGLFRRSSDGLWVASVTYYDRETGKRKSKRRASKSRELAEGYLNDLKAAVNG